MCLAAAERSLLCVDFLQLEQEHELCTVIDGELQSHQCHSARPEGVMMQIWRKRQKIKKTAVKYNTVYHATYLYTRWPGRTCNDIHSSHCEVLSLAENPVIQMS